jgi:hypothetical protein
MLLNGQCHCGAIHYEMPTEVLHHALCHCTDCRRHSGAPMVAWAMVPVEQFRLTRGQPAIYHSSEHGRRHFCAACGTSLFYVNEAHLPGMIDIQTATLDTPDVLPPTAHIQVADRISWMKDAHTLPAFDRYPG